MLSLPELIERNCLPNWRHDTIPFIMQLCKYIRLQLDSQMIMNSVLIFRQKASYLFFYAYPEQIIFASAARWTNYLIQC
ncbi:MAG TPA: hypothetical protein DGB85_07130 [Deltaproteobacteria bacterium]|nr:hypothetical protein [Deltaproteobacteria bacterium]